MEELFNKHFAVYSNEFKGFYKGTNLTEWDSKDYHNKVSDALRYHDYEDALFIAESINKHNNIDDLSVVEINYLYRYEMP